MIDINLTLQKLFLFQEGQLVAQYDISSGIAGNGEFEGSGQTPRGWHCVCQKIGQNLSKNQVLKGREPTGEIYSEMLERHFPERDWILSRILWLQGMEPGKNRFGKVDSKNRYIYIHGTPDNQPIGSPASHGCIRMRNHDVMQLFEQVPAGMPVFIHE